MYLNFMDIIANLLLTNDTCIFLILFLQPNGQRPKRIPVANIANQSFQNMALQFD